MAGINPEMQEPLENKQKKFEDTYKEIGDDASMKKALDSLTFGNEVKAPLQVKDIADAASSQINKGFNTSNLNPNEKTAANELLAQMKEQLGKASSPKDAIKIYADFRTELISVVGTGNAKNAKGLLEYNASMKATSDARENSQKQFDFLEFARNLGKSLIDSQKSHDQNLKRNNEKIKAASKNQESIDYKAASEVLTKWPK